MLSPGERTVADLILAFPGRLATHSATELAQLAGASKATVTRCFRRLGYASYAEVRSEVRREQLWGSPYYLEQGSNQWSSPHLALEAHVAADSELLGATVDALTAVDLGAVIAALGGARRVVFIGYRNSHLPAGWRDWAPRTWSLRSGFAVASRPSRRRSRRSMAPARRCSTSPISPAPPVRCGPTGR